MSMSRFDVCSAVQQSDIAGRIVPIIRSVRVGRKKYALRSGGRWGHLRENPSSISERRRSAIPRCHGQGI